MESLFTSELLFGENILNQMHIFIGPWFDYFMIFITTIGNEAFYVFILPLLYWCYDKETTLKIGIVFLISMAINDMIKYIYKNPRPDIERLLIEIRPLAEKWRPESPGFPSGHTQGSLSFFGSMSFFIKNKYILAAGCIMFILIPYSRIYLGVHYLGDVLGGYIIGLICLVLFIPAVIFVLKYHKKLKPYIIITACIAIPILTFVFLPGKNVNRIMGVLSGFLIGAYSGSGRFSFYPKNSILNNVLKCIIGFAGVIIIKEGIKFLLPDIPAAGFFRYWLIGFWCTLISPFIFSKLRALQGKDIIT